MSHPNAPTGFLHRFLDHAERHPDAVAVCAVDEGRELTYRDLRREAERFNGAFGAAGVGAGDRVLILLPNGSDLVAAYLGAMGRGAVPVLANPKLTARELGAVLADARPAVIATTGELARKHAGRGAAPGLRAVLTVDEAPALEGAPVAVTSVAATARGGEPLRAPDGDPVVTIQYTYKGLGYPLPVAHRYGALGADVDAIHEELHPQGVGSRFLVLLPLYSIFGLAALLALPLSLGATMVVTNAVPRADIADLLAEHRVTLVCLVPDLVRVFIAQLRKRTRPLPELDPRLMIYSGGSHLSFDTARELGEALGRPPALQGYGLTESFPVVAQSSVRGAVDGSLGRPLRGVEVRVVDDAGRDVAPGQAGELLVRGPMVAREYVDRPEATARFFRDGWLHTGDLVTRDEDGNLFFVGRRLRITKVLAQMVDLAEIEAVAAAFPGVARARARVVRDSSGRNGLRLTVETRAEISPPALTAHLRASLSAFKVPRQVDVVCGGARCAT